MDLKSFLKKVVGTVEREVKAEIKKAENSVQQRPAQSQSSQSPQPQPTAAPQREKTSAEWVAYFRDILTSEFGQYSIRENVAVQEIAGNAEDEFQLYKSRPRQVYKAEWGKPYTFVLYQEGMAKGVVMLGNGHSHDSNVKYLIARVYAKKMNIPYINFYTQMPNERDYVIGRIRKFLNL